MVTALVLLVSAARRRRAAGAHRPRLRPGRRPRRRAAVGGAARSQGLDLRARAPARRTAPDPATSRRALVMSVTAALGGAALVAEHGGEVVAHRAARRPVGRRRRGRPADGRVEPADRRRRRAGDRGHGPCRTPTARRGARHPRWRRWGAPGAAGARPTSGSPGWSWAPTPRCATTCARCSGRCSTTTAAGRRPGRAPPEAYFAAGSSPRHAATKLHVHVNTVAQRLDRIGELLGTDWQDPNRALQIQLALHLRHLTG